jgi:hypothetical protein
MKSTILVFIVSVFCFSVQAKEIQVDGPNLTFQSPDSFSEFTPELISIKFPSSRAPKHVIGTESGATCIAYDITPNAVTPDQLPDVRKLLTETFDRVIPGIEWVENKIIKKDETQWIYLEMTSRAIDQDIHNIMLATSYKGQLLIFNFNSTKKDFPAYESALRESINSIKVKQ